MIINRQILNKHTTQKSRVNRILDKARTFNIAYDKMSPKVNGALYPTVHFEKADWVEAQQAHIKVMRKNSVAINVKLLEFVEGLK